MDVIQDLFTFVNKMKNSKTVDLSNLGKSHMRSISAYSGNSIYYFPVLSSDSVSPETLAMVSRALERVYSSFVTASFNMLPVVDGDNIAEALKSVHQNMGMEQSLLSLSLNEAAMRPYCNLPYNSVNEAATINTNTSTSLAKPKGVDKTYSLGDYKKVTEMTPSILNVKLKLMVNNAVVDHTVTVGVKTTVHPLNAEKLCERIVDTITGRGIIHDLVRWTTGEVVSLKDIIFGINRMKKNFNKEKNDRETNKWIDALRNRERLSDLSVPALSKKAFLPNATVVLTKSDVAGIMTSYSVDLMNVKFARRLLKDNFLLGFVIVDDITETMHVLYDGFENYQTYHYNSVERENAKHDKSMQTLMKALGKMR